MIRYFLFAVLLSFTACNNSEVNNIEKPITAQNSLLGAWELQEVHWHTKDTTYSIAPTQPGLLVLTDNRYALMWSPSPTPRVPFENLSKPTVEEIQAGFRSVVFNGGTYSNTDSTLTTSAIIAKVPGFEGGKQFYKYNIADDTLDITMFDETYPNGDKPEWFGTWTTQFIYTKAK